MKVAIIGGGAAGFFAAISCKQQHPDVEVVIYEKSLKLLSKVKISGGGRCNVTNNTFNINQLSKNYPRGEKQLKKAFSQFGAKDTVEWFESRGVKTYVQADNCIFPKSNDSQSIIDCLINEAKKLGVLIQMDHGIESVLKFADKYTLKFRKQKEQVVDRVVVTIGGQPKMNGLEWLKEMGHSIEFPVPSLFTFNMPKEAIRKLMGVVVEPALVRVQGTKLKDEGILLITHWGMSGPVILKLSAWGARVLHDLGYKHKIQVSWVGEFNEDKVRVEIANQLEGREKKKVKNAKVFELPTRLWDFLLEKAEIRVDETWSGMGKKTFNRLLKILTNDVYDVQGKTTFKEEFVTCGGVSLNNINIKSMESKVCPGMFFAGEVLDIDGITGGFNFQAAWTTGFIAGKNAGNTTCL